MTTYPLTGADWAWYTPTEDQLNAAGIRLCCRYLMPAARHSGKELTAAEAQRHLAAGRTILLNYEYASGSEQGGYAAGQRDAHEAETARMEVGAPALPIYFSVDYDERNAGRVVDYLNGVASVIGRDRTGVYGSYYVVRAALDAGFRWAWQTYAWSGGQWDGRAQVRQVANDALWGGQGDKDVALAPFGGWSTAPITPDDEEDDDMASTMSLDLPRVVGETAEHPIEPSNQGAAGIGPEWLTIATDAARLGPAAFRIAYGDGHGHWAVDTVTLDAGNIRYVKGLGDGWCVVAVERIPAYDGDQGDPKRQITACVAMGRRA